MANLFIMLNPEGVRSSANRDSVDSFPIAPIRPPGCNWANSVTFGVPKPIPVPMCLQNRDRPARLGLRLLNSSPPPANQPRPLSTAMASWHRGTHAFRLVITFRNRLRLPSRNRMMHYGGLKGVYVPAVLALGTVQAPSITGTKREEGVKHTILSHRKSVPSPSLYRMCLNIIWCVWFGSGFAIKFTSKTLWGLHHTHTHTATTNARSRSIKREGSATNRVWPRAIG